MNIGLQRTTLKYTKMEKPGMRRFQASNIIFCLLIIMFGLALLLLSTNNWTFSQFNISSALSMIGSFLVVAAIVSFYFENFAKFQMFEEVFERVIGSASAFRAGVVEHYQNSKDINFSTKIKRSKSLTTFFTYSDGFLKRYKEEIEELIKRDGKVKLIFAKPDAPIIEIMKKSGWNPESISANYAYIRKFAEEHADNKSVKVVYCDAIPRYSAVVFDHEMYIIEQTVSKGQRAVPAMKIDGGGYLAEFYKDDLARLG